jgi:glycerol-3-phosphate acyltransferase PlsY
VLLTALMASYLIGSIPFGYILARIKGIDIRQYGSGNIGATNVWRAMGPLSGITVLLLDALKGVAAVVIGRQAGIEGAELLAGAAVLLGHAFPVYIGFKGGKIIATSAGVMAALAPLATLLAASVFAVVVPAFRYVSLGSVCAALSLPLFFIALNYSRAYILFGVFVCVVAVFKHIPNIKRIFRGTESKISFKRR